ncbi:hypothetical protein C6P46_003542, partial [Rhodotorula mucilaginosa]
MAASSSSYRSARSRNSHYHKQHEASGYSLGRIIGEGTFGKVRLGVHRLTGTRVAIKQVPKSLPS